MDALRPNRACTDRAALDAPPPPNSPDHASPSAGCEGALLRALLAGAVALLLMLLPAQLAASGGAAIHLAADGFEIMHHHSC